MPCLTFPWAQPAITWTDKDKLSQRANSEFQNAEKESFVSKKKCVAFFIRMSVEILLDKSRLHIPFHNLVFCSLNGLLPNLENICTHLEDIPSLKKN